MMHRISKLYLSLANLAVRQQNVPLTLHSEMPDCRGGPFGALWAHLDFGRGKRLHEYIDERHKKYGPLFRGRMGPTQSVFVSSPTAIRDVFRAEGPTPLHFLPEAWTKYNKMRSRQRGLLFMDGQEWWHYRRILNKVMFGPDSINLMSKPCHEAAKDLIQKWKIYTNNNRIVPDLESQLYQWSIEVLLATLVGKAWPTYRLQILPELESLSRSLSKIFEYSVALQSVKVQGIFINFLPSWRNFVNTVDETFATLDTFMAQMKKLQNIDDGMLQRMKHEGIGDDVLRRILIDLILAAGDTTAFSMQWLLFLIGSNLQAQESLHNRLRGLDIKQVLNDTLLRGAIKESLRLYPTAPFLTRILPKDTLLDGYHVNKHELICISLYTSGRDEASFPKANEFLPERWLRNEKGELQGVKNLNSTLPFAMGTRSCVGKKLAETQISIMTAELLKNFKIDCLNKNNIKIKLRMITAPSEPLQLRLTSRR